MTLIPIAGVAAWKAGKPDVAPVSPKCCVARLPGAIAWATGSARACGSTRRDIEPGSTAIGSLRLAVQDVALSRRKQGFEFP